MLLFEPGLKAYGMLLPLLEKAPFMVPRALCLVGLRVQLAARAGSRSRVGSERGVETGSAARMDHGRAIASGDLEVIDMSA